MVEQTRKSWADRQGIPTGVMGETISGILISEENRATVYERFKEGIAELKNIEQYNYRHKGVQAITFGVHFNGTIRYAVFCQNGFIKDVGAEG